MEVIEDGNIMDRIPILLQRDIEYYEKNHTVLSESVCRGVVGGRLDFPRNASFAAVKIVLWLEDEFSIAFNQGSGMFVTTEEDKSTDGGVAKTSDPDKFVQLAVKSADLLLEHLHMLAQEALDHADLPVLTSTLGAAALLKNSLYCYLQHTEDMGSTERHSMLQACYKRYATMAEAVGERVLDLHCRVLALYVLQDAGRAPGAGAPSVQGWWLYMNGSRKDLWDTVPPRMAQRIFAGMLNETLTILAVRYCQSTAPESENPALINDILNILQCVACLLPGVCATGAELAGAATARHVRDVHAKCDELFNCMVYRGAELHIIHQVFKEPPPPAVDAPAPWFAFASPQLFPEPAALDALPLATAVALELLVLLAQPQPDWPALVKVIMMRDCHLARLLLTRACAADTGGSGGGGGGGGGAVRCGGVLCTADGSCAPRPPKSEEEELALASGALTYVLAAVGSRAELQSTLCNALEMSGRDWSACLDKRQLAEYPSNHQVWCDRRPAWLTAILALLGTSLDFLPPILIRAVQSGASMYQTMSLALSCMSLALGSVPRSFLVACEAVQAALPASARPAGAAAALQAMAAAAYDGTLRRARVEAAGEAAAAAAVNGGPARAQKHVRIAGHEHSVPSASFDGAHSSASAIALAVAEALCSLDEDHKHTTQIEQLVAQTRARPALSDRFGLDEFPEFADFYEEGSVDASNAERASDAAVLTSRILMTPAGRDSLRVIHAHLHLHADWIFARLGLAGAAPPPRAPLLYTMFHVGRAPFDQYLSGARSVPWRRAAAAARARGGAAGARAHVLRRLPRARSPLDAELAALLRAPEPTL